MGKILGAVGAAIAGLALAGVSAFAVYSSNTSAPSHNPAQGQVIDYGSR